MASYFLCNFLILLNFMKSEKPISREGSRIPLLFSNGPMTDRFEENIEWF